MTPVRYDEGARLWLLSTPNTAYVLRLAADGGPAHVHWGPPLTLEQALAVPYPQPVEGDSFAEVADDEYPAEGGARFGAPALLIRHADGSRGVEWQYVEHTIDGGLLTIRFRDRGYPLGIDLHYRTHPDSDVIERWTTLHHVAAAGTGSSDGAAIEVRRADSARWVAPARAGYRLSHLVGNWSSEMRLEHAPLPYAETVLTSRRGVTSHQAQPWLMLDAGDAGEDHGEVWSTALAWSGSWRITVRRTPGGRVGWTGGAGHDGLSWRLKPGETWQTPVFAGLYTARGFGAASRGWHDFVVRHVLPQPDEPRPVLYNSWEATGFDVSVEGQRRLATAAAALGVELFVMDDGWFGDRRDDTAGLGDWTPSGERFPDGLDPLVAEVRRLGMQFGLWVEPEMVNPDSRLYREHPDWVLHLPNRKRTELRNQLVLNFARADVADWAHKWLDRLVTDHDIDFLKWDMNRPFTEAGWPDGDDADRLWFDHVRQVYALIDRLRADHPRLRIEACAGGGGRVDLGMLGRTDQVWTSDNTDAFDRIAIQHGYGQLYPARTMVAWVTDNPNPLTGRRLPLRFRFHMSMTGVLGIGGNVLTWSAEELREAAELVELYKDIRPVVQHGVAYRIDSGVQYVHGDRVVVVNWRVPGEYGVPAVPARLTALDPSAVYRDDAGRSHHGAVLLAHGLPWQSPPGEYASRVVRLTIEEPPRGGDGR